MSNPHPQAALYSDEAIAVIINSAGQSAGNAFPNHLLRYLAKEVQSLFGGEALLFRLLHHAHFSIPRADLASLAIYLQQGGKDRSVKHFRQAISNPLLLATLGLYDAAALANAGQFIEDHFQKAILHSPEELYVLLLKIEIKDKHLSSFKHPIFPEKSILQKLTGRITMSYSSLSKYLECPTAFYYEKILRAPFLKSPALYFGSAMHEAMEVLFKKMQSGIISSQPEEIANAAFVSALKSHAPFLTQLQYATYLERGKQALNLYLKTYPEQRYGPSAVEYKVERFYLQGVPVTGFIDRIDFHDDGCVVTDYKSGNAYRNTVGNQAFNPAAQGSDYWRQMTFYSLLIRHQPNRPMKVKEGIVDYLEMGINDTNLQRIEIPITTADEAVVLQELKQAYAAIMNLEFSAKCGSPRCFCSMGN